MVTEVKVSFVPVKFSTLKTLAFMHDASNILFSCFSITLIMYKNTLIRTYIV